jgi:cell division protein FtsB
MAEGDRPPTYTAAVVDREQKMTPVWYRFITSLARRLLAASQVETIATADIAASAVAVSSADAATQTGAYVQADVQTIATLANELKTDLTALIAEINANRALVNELKATVNEITAALNE